MSRSFSIRKFFKLFFFFGILVAIIFFLFRNKSDNSFPNLSGGTYFGTINGLSPDSNDEIPFYLEKFNGANTLLVVVFAQKWRPQVISLQANTIVGDYNIIDQPYMPIELANSDTSFLLYGRKKDNNFEGEIISTKGTTGNWSIEQIDIDKIKLGTSANFDLKDWLTTRVKHQDLADQINTLLSNLQEQENKYQKISKFVEEDGEILREKAKTKKELLSTELNKVAEERKQITQQTNQALSDLYLLGKMTKKGQSIELARRISSKENDLLNSTWGNLSNPAVLEEQLAREENIDLNELNENYKKALEVEQLNQSILEEEKKIADLENRINNPSSEEEQELPPAIVEETPTPVLEHKKPAEKDKNIWWNILE